MIVVSSDEAEVESGPWWAGLEMGHPDNYDSWTWWRGLKLSNNIIFSK